MDHKIEAAAQLAHQLSEGQKIVLRRVHALQQSKEIARELGISKEAVDKRVEAAMQRLGVTSRREAAMALSLSEQNCLYDRIISDPVELSTTPSNGASGLPHATGQRFPRLCWKKPKPLMVAFFPPGIRLTSLAIREALIMS